MKMIWKNSHNKDNNEGYFCSELIADAFKVLNILPNDINSFQYLPGSFSAEYDLKLENGAKFGDEFMIEVDQIDN